MKRPRPVCQDLLRVLMDTPRPSGDRVPLGDLTNTTHGGNETRSGLVPLDGDLMHKRQREREKDANEKSSDINKKGHQRYKMSNEENVEHDNNMAAHSTDGNTTNNEMDENSDWLHRQMTYSNGLQQLSSYSAN